MALLIAGLIAGLRQTILISGIVACFFQHILQIVWMQHNYLQNEKDIILIIMHTQLSHKMIKFQV